MKAPFLVLVVALAIVSGAISGGMVATVLDEDGATTVVVQPTPAAGEVAPQLPNIPEVVEQVRESVVSIDVQATVRIGPRTTVAESSGTGFVISEDGLIATNAHVVSDAQTITITFSDGSTAAATLVGSDSPTDLAVLRVPRTGLTPLAVGSSADMRVGDLVIAIGNALALEGGPTVSLGIISAKDRTITAQDGSSLSNLIQTDAAINEGDSGGPLVNDRGEVIGINTISASEAQNIGFAIAIDAAIKVMNGLING